MLPSGGGNSLVNAARRRLQKQNPATGTSIGSAITFRSPQEAQNYSSKPSNRLARLIEQERKGGS